MSTAFWFMIAVTSTAFFTFLAFAIWFDGRQKERETHYRDEMARRISEAGDSAPILDYVRAVEASDAEKARLKFLVSGVVTAAAGAGLMVFLHELVTEFPVYLVGLIPLLIGLSLVVLAQFMTKSAR